MPACSRQVRYRAFGSPLGGRDGVSNGMDILKPSSAEGRPAGWWGALLPSYSPYGTFFLEEKIMFRTLMGAAS